MTSNFQDDLIRRVRRLQQIIEQNLAPRITNIEQYLSTLTERVQNKSVIVTGVFTTEKITPLNISETELIEVYNNVPKVLLKNSILTELTAKSYREDKPNEPILLETDEHGKYWVIVCDKNHIFLTPSINIKFHIHKLKTVLKIFDFRGITPSVDTHCLLIKPARVSNLPNGKEWKLLEKGILEFTNHISSVSFQSHLDTELQEGHNSEIKKINNQLNDFKLELENLQQENLTLKSQLNLSEIKDNQANTNVEILKIYKQLNQIKLELEQLDNLKSILENFGEEQNNLASKIGKITVLIDYVNMHIDLIRVRLETLENKDKNNIITDSLDD